MPTRPEDRKPPQSLDLSRIEQDGKDEIDRRIQRVVDWVLFNNGQLDMKRVTRLDGKTLRGVAVQLAESLRNPTRQPEPQPSRKSPNKTPAARTTTKPEGKTTDRPKAPRAARQSIHWRDQRTTRAPFTKRARRVGLITSLLSGLLVLFGAYWFR